MKNFFLILLILASPALSSADVDTSCYPFRCDCYSLAEKMDQIKQRIFKIEQEEQSVKSLNDIISSYQELKEIQNINISYYE